MTLFFIIVTHLLSTSGISEVRRTYFLAVDNEDDTNQLLEMCEGNNDPVYMAYRGVAYTLKANYSYNPVKKLNYFEKGKQLIEKAVKKKTTNLEIRFLRLTVQKGAPSMLGYYSNIKRDKNFIKQNLVKSSLPGWYKKKINAYLDSK